MGASPQIERRVNRRLTRPRLTAKQCSAESLKGSLSFCYDGSLMFSQENSSNRSKT